MSGDVAVGVITLLAAVLLFGRGVVARGRTGAPIARYGLIWAAVFAGLFGLALLLPNSR